MKFKLEFTMDNAAFTQYPEGEAARILNEVSIMVIKGDVYGVIKDYNGSTIGKWDIEE